LALFSRSDSEKKAKNTEMCYKEIEKRRKLFFSNEKLSKFSSENGTLKRRTGFPQAPSTAGEQRSRAHFTPGHWLVCHLGLY
jgi:hypothetical protein